MNGLRLFTCFAVALGLCGCGDSDAETEGFPALPGPTFDVTGTWTGTATDDDSELLVTLVLTNNGGPTGMALAGEFILNESTRIPFRNSYITPLAGATRAASIRAADEVGYSYELQGEFTSLRMDEGQFTSSNPALDIDIVYLETTLVRRP